MEFGFAGEQTMIGKTWKEIEADMLAELEAEEQRKVQEEQRRAEELEKLQKMSFAEYIAHRSGLPMPPSNEELASMSIEEYIKARQRY